MNKHRTILQQKKPLMSTFLILALLYLIMCPFAHSLTPSSNATALLPQKQILKNISPQKECMQVSSSAVSIQQVFCHFNNQTTILNATTGHYKSLFSLTLISTSRLIL
jgi:hypothetical protein